jgi:hypothetical protein
MRWIGSASVGVVLDAAAPRPTLPAATTLLDLTAMNAALARHPEASARLYALRGEALLRASWGATKRRSTQSTLRSFRVFASG